MTTELPEPFRDDWERVGSRTQAVSITLVSIDAETTLFEHRGTPDIGESDVQPRSLIAVALEISPPLSMLGLAPDGVFSLAAGTARDRFVDLIEAEDVIVEGERKTVEFDRGDGTPGRWHVLETAHPLEDRRLETETHLAIWPTAESFAMAGGTLPLEAPADAEASMEVNPQRDRDTIAAFVRELAGRTIPDGAPSTDPNGASEPDTERDSA